MHVIVLCLVHRTILLLLLYTHNKDNKLSLIATCRNYKCLHLKPWFNTREIAYCIHVCASVYRWLYMWKVQMFVAIISLLIYESALGHEELIIYNFTVCYNALH